MRLFISYARVDKPYCIQIVEILDAHDVWFDHRIHVGQDWWQVITEEIADCEGFVYLISPESLESTYCQREFSMARSLKKHVFPVLIHKDATVPEELKRLQHADLTDGLSPQGVKDLLNAIHVTERKGSTVDIRSTQEIKALAAINQPLTDPVRLIEEVTRAMHNKHFDHAVFLLKEAKENGIEARFVNIEAMLNEAEHALERQTYMREAERHYAPIVKLVECEDLRGLGCRAFETFRKDFPDYDPKGIAKICSSVILPDLQWCDVPAGEVTIEYEPKHITYYVNPFRIGKYPVTNAQFQAFMDAEDGYCNKKWWDFSAAAIMWREKHEAPLPSKFQWGDHPRANVSWYEAMAFCQWITERTGLCISLLSEAQWQRAAQGDDGRHYPWGDKFDKSRCNTRESNLRATTKVGHYGEEGCSPFGVQDMAGNVWQWCVNTEYKSPSPRRNGASGAITKDTGDLHTPRAVRGGSFISVAQRAKTTFHFYLNPMHRYASIGFRLAWTD